MWWAARALEASTLQPIPDKQKSKRNWHTQNNVARAKKKRGFASRCLFLLTFFRSPKSERLGRDWPNGMSKDYTTTNERDKLVQLLLWVSFSTTLLTLNATDVTDRNRNRATAKGLTMKKPLTYELRARWILHACMWKALCRCNGTKPNLSNVM